jgi:hypothetical protein
MIGIGRNWRAQGIAPRESVVQRSDDPSVALLSQLALDVMPLDVRSHVHHQAFNLRHTPLSQVIGVDQPAVAQRQERRRGRQFRVQSAHRDRRAAIERSIERRRITKRANAGFGP